MGAALHHRLHQKPPMRVRIPSILGRKARMAGKALLIGQVALLLLIVLFTCAPLRVEGVGEKLKRGLSPRAKGKSSKDSIVKQADADSLISESKKIEQDIKLKSKSVGSNVDSLRSNAKKIETTLLKRASSV